MPGRKRRIYFFEPVEVDAADRVTTFDETFWPSFHDHVHGLAIDDGGLNRERLRLKYLGNKYSGSARTEVSPAERFFYVAKARPGSDWPDVELPDEGTSPLSLTDPSASLVEPAYLLPVWGTSYVAALRTSGGPSWSALENWIGAVSGRVSQESRFALRPYVRLDQLERLHESLGVSKVHLKLDPGSQTLSSVEGVIAKALKGVQDLGAGGVSVELGLSFGRATPDEAAAEEIAQQVEKLVRNVRFKTARATIMQMNSDGVNYSKQNIDFYADRVTGSEYVGTNEDEVPTAPVVLKAMTEAIRKFRGSLD